MWSPSLVIQSSTHGWVCCESHLLTTSYFIPSTQLPQRFSSCFTVIDKQVLTHVADFALWATKFQTCLCHAFTPEFRTVLIIESKSKPGTMSQEAELYICLYVPYVLRYITPFASAGPPRWPAQFWLSVPASLDRLHSAIARVGHHYCRFVCSSFTSKSLPSKSAGCTLCNSCSSGCEQYTVLNIWWGQKRLSPESISWISSVYLPSMKKVLHNSRRSAARNFHQLLVFVFCDPVCQRHDLYVILDSAWHRSGQKLKA